ncbi:MlaD family protein [Aerobium aerolatum]|uniref:Phospholipid/cholesterol/gamma-HCH transport system substrate-binding protein n=1 Tax=Aquamicrobium aerolatum DSM 21857 TaxID=1121003 RepID=A0A1I3KBD2_9HYPH|nr:MlaD family protein [Aquamicrobium aerolatum]SFI69809.1 phospholipid/cholesterol/gamma-HCH transport system substrate-binding protein [Aquamicrobium aerolatum DSM 21857]
METRANYVIVGIFTLVTVLAAFAFVYWTSGLGDRVETSTVRFRIPGSASGLSRGSAVLFNGIKVGDITRVYIDVANPTVAIADAVVDRLTPITRSTQADVGLAGLTTGQANIELRGGNPSEPNLLEQAEEQGTITEMTANPSAVSNLLESAQNIFRRTDSILTDLERLAGDARQPITKTLQNVEAFSEALSNNAEGIDAFLASVTAMSKTLTGVSERLDSTLAGAEELIRSVDTEDVTAAVHNVRQFTQRLDEASTDLNQIMANVKEGVASISGFAAAANQTLARVDTIVQEVDPATVRTALANIEQASTSVNAAVNDVSKVTQKIGERAEDIDAIIVDAREMAARLNQASEKVDGVLSKVDGLLGSDDAGGLMADAGETLKAFRQVADTLNARMGVITDGLARFSGQGLREVEGLVRDTRRSITRIEQAVSDLERNPQRIISGGAGEVREFDGRARR